MDRGPWVDQIPDESLRRVLARTTILALHRRETGLLCTGKDEHGDDADEADSDASHTLPERLRARLTGTLPEETLLVVRDGANGCHIQGGDPPAGTTRVPAPEAEGWTQPARRHPRGCADRCAHAQDTANGGSKTRERSRSDGGDPVRLRDGPNTAELDRFSS